MGSLLRSWRRLRRNLTLGHGPRAEIVRRFLWVVFLFMVVAGLILAGFNYASGTGLFVPNDADEILEGAEGRPYYQWTSQAVHTFKVGDETVRQDSVRVVNVDPAKNRFVVDVTGALPDVYRFQSDGKVTIRNTLTRHQAGQPPQLINDVCEGEEAVPAALAALPSGEVLAQAKPKLIDPEGEEKYQGENVWVMEFQPTPEIIEHLLLVPLLERGATPAEQRWALSESEAALIEKGEYEVEEAVVVVAKTKPRQIAAIDVTFSLPNGRSWHILAATRPAFSDQRPLDDLNLGEPNC